MKKLIFYFFLQTFLLSGLFAKIPIKFGNVTKDELQMASYANDPSAPAVVLCDYGTVEVGPRTEYFRHVRIKILQSSGARYASIEIPYKSYDRFDVVSSIKAQTYNLAENGNVEISKVKGKDLQIVEVDSRNKKVVFTFPNVKPGSVIEYKYNIYSLDLTHLNNWYFQTDIPTILSDYTLSVPRRFDYLITFQKGKPLDVSEQMEYAKKIQWLYDTNLKKIRRELLDSKGLLYESPKGTAKVYFNNGESMHFKMKDIPALKPTADMFAFSDYYPVVKTQLFYADRGWPTPFYYRTILDAAQMDYASWSSTRLIQNYHSGYVVFWLPTWEEFNSKWIKDNRLGGILDKNDENKRDSALIHDSNKLKVVQDIYKYVKETVKWNGIYTMYATEKLKNIVEKKIGSSGDLNLLLISMLNNNGFEAEPVLIRTRNLGRIENMYPASEQFNHVIAQVKIEGKTVFIDATNNSDDFLELPKVVMSANGWLLDKNNFGWVNVKNPEGNIVSY
jgi:hypothetical protein